jgi:dihydroxy-acid dehydratase
MRICNCHGKIKSSINYGLWRHHSGKWKGIAQYCSAFEALGKNLIIQLPEDFKGYSNACPGAGACGGMYTANTMSSAMKL